MKKHILRVPLICGSACVLFLDLSMVIDLLNMGASDLSGGAIFGYVLANLLLVALWVFYFLKLPSKPEE